MDTLPQLPDLPTYDDVVAAAERIRPHAYRTPVLTSRTADAEVGAQLFFKCENYQRMGAFKFRGAMNALARFSPAQRAAGVVAYSSGNHGQAIALSASILDIPATVVMPQDAPASKIAATIGYGARVLHFDRYTEDREQICADLVKQHGMTLVPPFDHPDEISGQGTAAKELLEQAGPLDALFVSLGGGGLLAGSLLAAKALAPHCQTYGVEPEAANDAQQSLRAGRIIHIAPPRTIADGAQTPHVGHYTFAIMRRDVADIVTVSDAELIECMRFYAERMKMVVEPTGCLSLAAVRKYREQLRGKRVGVIVSGGNVDLSRLAHYLA
jgi:threonine dehydratase